jgi:hypothetical protein
LCPHCCPVGILRTGRSCREDERADRGFTRIANFRTQAENGSSRQSPDDKPQKKSEDVSIESITFRRRSMHIPHLQPLVALIAGILILVKPKLLNYIIAFYLILVGVMGLVNF